MERLLGVLPPDGLARFQRIQVPWWVAVLLLIALVVLGVVLYKARGGGD